MGCDVTSPDVTYSMDLSHIRIPSSLLTDLKPSIERRRSTFKYSSSKPVPPEVLSQAKEFAKQLNSAQKLITFHYLENATPCLEPLEGETQVQHCQGAFVIEVRPHSPRPL